MLGFDRVEFIALFDDLMDVSIFQLPVLSHSTPILSTDLPVELLQPNCSLLKGNPWRVPRVTCLAVRTKQAPFLLLTVARFSLFIPIYILENF